MSAFGLAVALSVASAVCYGGGAVAQRQVAERIGRALTARVILTVLVRTRLWWLALLLNSAGAVLHVVALAYGALIVVQPLGLLALVFALPWAARLEGLRVSGRQWRGAVLTIVALSAMLVVVADTEGEAALAPRGALVVLGSTLAGALALSAAARWMPAVRRSRTVALAAGVTFGAASALTKAVIESVEQSGAAGLWHPALPGIAVLAATGVLLSQGAYRGVTVGSPLATISMANPVAASFVGVAVMGETFTAGAWGLLVAVASAALAVAGIYLLTVAVAERPPVHLDGRAQARRHAMSHSPAPPRRTG